MKGDGVPTSSCSQNPSHVVEFFCFGSRGGDSVLKSLNIFSQKFFFENFKLDLKKLFPGYFLDEIRSSGMLVCRKQCFSSSLNFGKKFGKGNFRTFSLDHVSDAFDLVVEIAFSNFWLVPRKDAIFGFGK